MQRKRHARGHTFISWTLFQKPFVDGLGLKNFKQLGRPDLHLVRVDDHRKLKFVILEEGSLEAAHASGLYGYPHEAEDQSKHSNFPGVLAPLQRFVLMADHLLLNQLLNVRGRMMKKKTPGRRIKRLVAAFWFPCVGTKDEGQEEAHASSSFSFADGGWKPKRKGWLTAERRGEKNSPRVCSFTSL